MKPADTSQPRETWITELVALLERQQGVVGKLRELARGQGTLIEQGRTEPLLGLLGQRQRLIDQFTALQADLARRTADLPRRLQAVAAADRDRVRGLIDDISGALTEIMQRDERDQEALGKARDGIKAELASHGAAQQARSAYTRPGYTPSRFADRQG